MWSTTPIPWIILFSKLILNLQIHTLFSYFFLLIEEKPISNDIKDLKDKTPGLTKPRLKKALLGQNTLMKLTNLVFGKSTISSEDMDEYLAHQNEKILYCQILKNSNLEPD